MGFNQRELRLIRARPCSSLLTVTHMSHSSSQTAVSSSDCGSRDLNAHFTYIHIIYIFLIHLYTTNEKKKSNSTLFGFNCRFQSGTSPAIHDKPVRPDIHMKKKIVKKKLMYVVCICIINIYIHICINNYILYACIQIDFSSYY